MEKNTRFQIQAFARQFPALFEGWKRRAVFRCPNGHLRYDYLTSDGLRLTCATPEGATEFCDQPVEEEDELTASRTAPLIREDHIEEVRVSRVMRELMDVTPCYKGATGSLVGIDDDDAIFLLRARL